jgi:hypothetical protein
MSESTRTKALGISSVVVLAVCLLVVLERLVSGPKTNLAEPTIHRESDEEPRPTSSPLSSEQASAGTTDEQPETPGSAETRRPAAAPVAKPKYAALTVHGNVLNAQTYKPIDGATIESNDLKISPGGRILARTNERGEFAIAGVAPGRFSYRVSAPGYLTATRSNWIPSDPPTVNLGSVSLVSNRSITVRFFGPDGRPLGEWCRRNVKPQTGENIGIFETRTPPPRLFALMSGTRVGGIDESNYLRVEWPSEVAVPVNLPCPLYLSAGFQAEPVDFDRVQIIGTSRIDSDGAIVQFTIPAEVFSPPLSRVRVCAVDAVSGAPLADARISLSPRATFGNAVQISSSDGCVRIENVKRSPHYLTIVAKGHEWIQEEVVVADAETDLGVYRLSAPTRLSGHVFDESGTVAGVNVFAYPLQKFERTRAIRSAFGSTTTADGSFELQSLGRESYIVRAQGSDWASIPQLVDTTSGDVQDIALRVSRGVEVHFDIGEPLADATLYITSSDKIPVAEHDLTGSRELTQHLVPGTYEWRIDAEDRKGESHALVVGHSKIDLRTGPLK